MWTRLFEATDRWRHAARARTVSPDAALGRRGEDVAHRFLQHCGFQIVARNWRAKSGSEIDIVARDGETLVFVEVKSRRTDEFGAPERAVGLEKEQHMLRAALEFARRADVGWENLRFDIVGIVFTEPPAITHLRDVIELRRH